ncbi:MAG: hypothetical protein Q8882_00935 [Bacillota bacterium]|nr:hypothetical protein [Bacillota bacterium]
MLNRKGTKTERITHGAYLLVLFSFLIPIGYLIYKIAVTNNIKAPELNYRSRADYVLMLVQCVLGVAVLHLPTIMEKRFKFELPAALYLMYIVFLYCAIFLGEVRSFYYEVPHWDVVLHCFSSIMAGAFGFIVVAILNSNEHVAINLSPFFVALFAFCFAVMIGAVWEIYEYTFDGLLGLNMQKYMLCDGTMLIGHQALRDTMKDIIVDCIGALGTSVAGYLSLKSNKGWATYVIAKYSKENIEELENKRIKGNKNIKNHTDNKKEAHSL